MAVAAPLNALAAPMIYNNTGTAGLQDADLFITLNKNHGPTADYVRTLRQRLPRIFPAVTFSFPPPDITSQILNFGAPAPLDVQVTGTNLERDAGLRAARAAPDPAGLRPGGCPHAAIQQPAAAAG